MKNAINWFEIPVSNFERAKSFYETILAGEVSIMPNQKVKYGFLPCDPQGGGVGGAIVEGEGCEPSDKGTLVYLNGGEDLNVPLSKTVSAGGKIVLEKQSIGEYGFIALIIDTEGNKIGLHSMK